MVRVQPKGGRGAKYRALLEDGSVDRWHRNVARGSQITADVYLRRLGHVCATHGASPAALVAMEPKERRDFVADLVSEMEDAGRAGSYVLSTVRSIKSWLAFNGVAFGQPIKVRGAQATPTLEKERVPTPDELRRILLAASPRDRCAAVLLAHAGLRPESLGNYRGTDGLRLGDLPDLRVKGKTVVFGKLPAQVVVRAELSKSGRRYFSFLGPEAAEYLKAYLEERMREGERLSDDSDVIAPAWSKKAFLTSINVSDAIRKAIRASGFHARPYVLRAYFDTQLLLAESKGKMTHAYRAFFMGHVGDIEARYTTNKGRLPPDLIEDMRDAYRRGLPFLETTKPTDRDAELKSSFRRQMLLVAGLDEREIAKMDLEGMTDAELQRIVRDRLVGASATIGNGNGNGPVIVAHKQTVVPLSAVDTYLERGWEWVTQVGDDRVVLKHVG
jgi:integrase